MIKKCKIIIFICVAVLFCNVIAKLYLIDGQKNRITLLQKKVSAARGNGYPKPDQLAETLFVEQNKLKLIVQTIPEEFSFTQYAASIRSLIDKHHLFLKDSLIFKPVKAAKPDRLLLKYNTNIIVSGSYGKIKSLISDIQNLPGIGYLDSARLVRQKDSENIVKLNLELSVFFKREYHEGK